MAGSVNKVILIGNLGKDPEVRTTQAGSKIVSFTLATSETWSDRASGERKERTEWHRVVVFSRLIWARFVVHQDLATVLRCHVAAFEALGGVPREILYDRMKTAVVGERSHEGIVFNRALIDIARHYGFHPKALWPYRAKTKGKVERPF